ncbi:MYND-type zinc finger-containing chromatin reader ZMYND8-like isoform X2 [Argiope bruennichi]|uniref:Protein kinase C-binding protein 1 like protein n=1 Tax=Argiope bruennichi TaxID=94029 RepID=A0A8T0F5I3_ARGBR|nr:MYND-type zinc finger-containing chromatin reader ZMYND8-like isoform X2 [Argiope bruennichi]KAF8786111.1 Protein kinase C-binding protein 1 like protein [Argiope bruennichi]
MRRCCVPGCPSNRKKPYVSVFQFPKSPGFRNLWLKRIGRPLLKVSENIGVCIKHFEKNCIVDYKDWKGEGGRKRITVKPGAVPSIFDQEEIDSLSDDADATCNKDLQEVATNMQARSSGSVFSEVTKQSVSVSTGSSPKKMQSSPTTDKPFIAIIKPEDSRTEEPASCEEIDDDSSSCEDVCKLSPNKANPDSLSPYKHFSSVNMCLKEEDQINAQKELGKAVKRTASVSSNNSSGSTEVAKLQPKRRKVEKPAPTVLGKQNDCYCWVCHRENVVLSCIACPRAYHMKCAGDNVVISSDMNDWVCPECKRILTAENVDTRSTVLSEISLDKLCTLLRFSLNKMKHRAGVAFHQPVSLDHYPMYPHYVIHPMDFSLLEKNIKQKLYGCTEAFLADVKWILHNSCVFNGSQHPLSTNAKSLVKACDNDMQEIEVCPDCFMHSIVRNKYWFSEVCRKPHPLVWAKLKGFPYWPAKVVRIADGFIDARFFGAHDRAWVPISQCYHLSKEMPTSSKPKKKGNYEIALDELNVHVQLLIQKFGKFEYAPYRTSFDQNNKLLAYHGIDIDKIDKEEIPCDTSSVEGVDAAVSTKDNENSSSSKCIKESSEDSEKKSMTHMNVVPSNNRVSCNDMKSSPKVSLGSEMIPQKQMKDSKLVDKSAEPASDSNQLNKIELVLQRIKGYISTVDDDNENIEKDASDIKENQTEEDFGENANKKDAPGTASKSLEINSKKKETEEISILSGLIKTKTLPSIEVPTISLDDVSEKDKVPTLDVVKKNDSFSLKLIETIESCKAKLGLSIESELDKIDSGDSESLDEDDEDDVEQEGEGDLSGDGEKHGKKVTSASEDASDESSSESDEGESNSHSSETDIETVEDANVDLRKDIEPEHRDDHVDVPDCQKEDNENKLTVDKDETEKHSHGMNTLIVTKSSPEASCEAPVQHSTIENFAENISCDLQKEHSENPSVEDRDVDLHSDISDKDPSNTSESLQRNFTESKTLSSQETLTSMDIDKDKGAQADGEKNIKNSTESDKIDEDDDIFICPPVKPPTPPLICLDDETEGDEKAESNSNFKNSGNLFSKQISQENSVKLSSVFGIPKLPTSARKSMKRVFKSPTSEEESSDEDFRVLPSSHGIPLSGAKRTFHNRDKNNLGVMSNSSVSQITSNEIHQSNEIGAREQITSVNETSDENNLSSITNILNKESLTSVEDNTQNSVPEHSDTLDEKDAEILNLRKKLSCLFSAFQLQHWKHNQEKSELRHNMNLIVMEMRASLEADKKQALETLSRTFEREKQCCIEETKKKQWCAHCFQESRYACCWNTSYCSVACQKRHFNEHKSFCTQLKRVNPVEVSECKNKSPSPNDGKENKKVFLLNVVSQTDALKSAVNQKETVVQQNSLPKIIASKAPVQLVPSSSSSTTPTVQLVLAPANSDNSPGPLQPKLVPTKLDNSESTESQNTTEKKGNNSVSILKPKTSEDLAVNEKNESKKEETNLEEIYFPSPPGISFEGLDTALPDDNIQFTHPKDASECYSPDIEQVTNNKMEDSSAEEDLNWSDIDDTDNELVNIGRGVEVSAKYLNKCLIYGQSAKKLTRCLIDVIFPDIKLLASCSAFGNKSNVTKLTRAALPARKVEAIIDFVLKRFPDASRSEIVLAINMKCKEARNIVGKTGNGNVKKTLFRRLLAKEQSMEANLANDSDPTTPKSPTTITLVKDPNVNVVCVSNASPSESTSVKTISPKTTTLTGPNIMRCNPQILIRPKGLAAVGSKLLVSPTTKFVRDQTKVLSSNVRPLVSSQKYGGKILLPIEVKTQMTSSSELSSHQNKQRPFIIIGSPTSTLPSGISMPQQNSLPMAMARK